MQLRAATGRLLAGLVGVFACTERSGSAPAPQPSSVSAPCPSGAKRCEGRCVASSPATGCGAASCAPCSPPHASAACSSADACAVDACESSFGDCDGDATNGCETDTRVTAQHCGACGHRCGMGLICQAGACVDESVVNATAYLASQTEGFCLDAYNKLMNLCGDVDFCFDSRFMRSYPDGIAVDLGFDWAGTHTGLLVDFGGDCDGERISFGIDAAGVFYGNAFGRSLQRTLAAGRHLASLQIGPTDTALFLDGVLVGVAGPPIGEIRLRDACGPGLVVGQRISYWWEAPSANSWNRLGVFLVQLREHVVDPDAYDVARATQAGPSSVLLFDATGIAGSRWTAHVGGLVAVGKNAQDGIAQLDAGGSGPPPEWKPLSACSLE